MLNLTEEQIARLISERARNLATSSARRHDVHDTAAVDFAAAILNDFDYDPHTDTLQRKPGVAETVTIDGIIDAARKTHPHRFRDMTVSAPAEQRFTGGKFSGVAANASAGDDFFALSPEEKIRIANEGKRPHGWK